MRWFALMAVFLVSCAATTPDVRPVVAIYADDWGLDSSTPRQPIVELWEDGSAICSADPANGGSPYRKGAVGRETVARLLAGFDPVFRDKRMRMDCVTFDSRFTTILLRSGRRKVELRLDESICLTAECEQFRTVWHQIRRQIAEALPCPDPQPCASMPAFNG